MNAVDDSLIVSLVRELIAAGYCGYLRRTRSHAWVCTRPHHGGNQPHTDAYRRRHGKTPAVDKHHFESPEEAAARLQVNR